MGSWRWRFTQQKDIEPQSAFLFAFLYMYTNIALVLYPPLPLLPSNQPRGTALPCHRFTSACHRFFLRCSPTVFPTSNIIHPHTGWLVTPRAWIRARPSSTLSYQKRRKATSVAPHNLERHLPLAHHHHHHHLQHHHRRQRRRCRVSASPKMAIISTSKPNTRTMCTLNVCKNWKVKTPNSLAAALTP